MNLKPSTLIERSELVIVSPSVLMVEHRERDEGAQIGLKMNVNNLLRLRIVLIRAARRLERAGVASVFANGRPSSHAASDDTRHNSGRNEGRTVLE